MTQMTQATQVVEGNTKTSTLRIRSRKWCFTLNNWTQTEFDTITQGFCEAKLIIGKETGECGTPHLQGFIECKNAISFNSVKKIMPRAHIEKAKGSVKENVNYCSKDNDIYMNFEIQKTAAEEYENFCVKEYEGVVWLDWQQKILDMINNAPERRTVNWIWEEKGNIGKSFLARYIDWKYDAIIANGKQADVFNQYKTYIEKEDKCPKVALIDIPRSHKDFVCYSTLEKIKDGLLYSGKYEGGKLRLIPHHLIIFANFEPEVNKLSQDRWNILMVSKGT